MTFRRLSSLLLAALMLGICAQSASAQKYPKLAPYEEIRWNPEVQIDGTWYILRSIDELPVVEMVAFAKRQYGPRWEKRISEDLVQVLTEMGRAPGETVRLVVYDWGTGQEETFDDVALTAKNRRSILDSRRTEESKPAAISTAQPQDLRRALDDFRAALDGRWSYRHANRADFVTAFSDLHQKVDSGISINEFGIELQKIVSLGIDGHAGVSGIDLPSEGYLPFLVEPVGDRFVAFKPDRSGFLVDGFPYLTKIDGKEVSDWCEVASSLEPKGSPQFVRRHCLRNLRALDFVRGLMSLPTEDVVEVELAAEEHANRKTLMLPVAKRSPTYGKWPRGDSRHLDGKIGYLRLSAMDENAVEEIREWMPKFRDTVGLVVDVRDNGGGSREALRWLYSYLASPDDPPRAFTAAAYRLHEEHQDDHLAQRFMYSVDSKEWTESERRAVARFARTFRPEWDLPEDQFSDWHYMVLSRLADPRIYHYPRPVVVLMNAKCFSATDIFLAGLKGMENVTLLGTSSGGGSALSQRVGLGATPFRLRIGSMASFQSNGKLFDGNGVPPDVEVEPVPIYYIGGEDNALEEAVERLHGR
ncbi:MAG: S41 family peptidase [Thermoanaerobaculia bacterium]|nr:S41 family peptidase [Thermoanaerobaculia bacterium]